MMHDGTFVPTDVRRSDSDSSIPLGQPVSPVVAVINPELGTVDAQELTARVEKMMTIIHALLLETERSQGEARDKRQRRLEDLVESGTILLSGLHATTPLSSPLTEDIAFSLFRIIGTELKQLQMQEPSVDQLQMPQPQSPPRSEVISAPSPPVSEMFVESPPVSEVFVESPPVSEVFVESPPVSVVFVESPPPVSEVFVASGTESDSDSLPGATQEYCLDGSPKLENNVLAPRTPPSRTTRGAQSPGAAAESANQPLSPTLADTSYIKRRRLRAKTVCWHTWLGTDLN